MFSNIHPFQINTSTKTPWYVRFYQYNYINVFNVLGPNPP